MDCPRCAEPSPEGHRFCAWCGTALTGQRPRSARRPKVSRWFWALPVGPEDPTHAALRVSCYLEEVVVDSSEGSAVVPKEHVRFSVWVDDRAVAAVSLTHDEARDLVAFLDDWLPVGPDARPQAQASAREPD